MIKNTFISLIILLTSTPVFSYWANCNTDNGRNFSITVENRVLIVDGKYKHYYQGKTLRGWYEYSNSKYTYKTGSFEEKGFPIHVVSSKGQTSDGWCSFR